MEYYFAPMEGVTGGEYRRAHHKFFSGVDRYYMPFISPTRDHVFTPRELRNISPEANEGIDAVPQLLTKEPEDFLWAAGELQAMGYREVNLNVGCPSGTVVAKGKGAGMLGDPHIASSTVATCFSSSMSGLLIVTNFSASSFNLGFACFKIKSANGCKPFAIATLALVFRFGLKGR